MADHAKTINNSLEFTAGGPSTKWNEFAWNDYKWDEGTNDYIQRVLKLVTNNLTPTSSVNLHAAFYLAINNALSPTSAVDLYFSTGITISNSLSLSFETDFEGLQDGSGWDYVFPSPSTDAENRNLPTYTEGSQSTTSYTSGTIPSTSWT